MSERKNELDPATVEIIRNQLRDIAEEMQASVMNSAYSTLWQEAGDLSCALLNRNGEIVGQSERVIPVHIATMTNSTRVAIEKTGGRDALRDGDMLIQNDPYSGNNHLPDFLIAKPVFDDGTLIGFSAVRGHWVDVGGSTPTSYSTNTSEIIQEGLRVPPGKLYNGGEKNQELFDVILANVRNPDERRGDMQAQIAGVLRGANRYGELANRYGSDVLLSVLEEILQLDEQQMRMKIRELPDGEYTAVDYIDSNGVSGGDRYPESPEESLLGIAARVTVDGSTIDIDFEGTAEQAAGGVNVPLSCTEAGAHYAVKVTLDPGDPGTLGAYRPISVIAPSGSLVNPEYPAPVVTGNHEGANRVYDTVVKAISTIDPSLAFGAGNGSSNGLSYRSQRTGQMNREAMVGGMGACPRRDGVSAIRSGLGNTGVQPVERVEQDYDFVTIEEFCIVPDTGGAGRYRGGNTARRVTYLGDACEIVTTGDRRYTRPFGVAGGKSGRMAMDLLITPDGEEIRLPSKTTRVVEAGSRIVIQPAGGGGYGDPEDRSQESVLSDVRNGYISRAVAKEDFDVTIGENDRSPR